MREGRLVEGMIRKLRVFRSYNLTRFFLRAFGIHERNHSRTNHPNSTLLYLLTLTPAPCANIHTHRKPIRVNGGPPLVVIINPHICNTERNSGNAPLTPLWTHEGTYIAQNALVPRNSNHSSHFAKYNTEFPYTIFNTYAISNHKKKSTKQDNLATLRAECA